MLTCSEDRKRFNFVPAGYMVIHTIVPLFETFVLH
jgi:hypothetical protein